MGTHTPLRNDHHLALANRLEVGPKRRAMNGLARDNHDIPLEKLVESVENAAGVGAIGELDDLAGGEYTWEAGYEKSWQKVQVDEGGKLLIYKDDADAMKWIKKRMAEKKKRGAAGNLLRKSVVRNVYLVLDFSLDANLSDFKPSRAATFMKLLLSSLPVLFERSPLMTIGLIVVCDRVATVVVHSSSDITAIMQGLENLCHPKTAQFKPEGLMSLYNGIQKAVDLLQLHPDYSTREIVIMLSSIQTVDSSPLSEMIPNLKAHNIQVSVLTLCAEMYIVKLICDQTSGLHRVALDSKHLEKCMNTVLETPEWNPNTNAQLLPVAIVAKQSSISVILCSCHQTALLEYYSCPKCCSTYCNVPINCIVCDLILVTAHDLYRLKLPYQMIPEFLPEPVEVPDDDEENPVTCDSCDTMIYVMTRKVQDGDMDNVQHRCPLCNYVYCSTCHMYMTNKVQQCLGCQLVSNLSIRGVEIST